MSCQARQGLLVLRGCGMQSPPLFLRPPVVRHAPDGRHMSGLRGDAR